MDLSIVNRPLDGLGEAYGSPGERPAPAIMVLHGSEGAGAGWSTVTCAILAAHGFLALPFGYGSGGNVWNAGDIVDVPLERTAAALAALRGHPMSTGKVGLYGVSRGGEQALLLAALMARDGCEGLPDAIAVHGAPDVVCGAFVGAMWRDQGDPGWQAWDPARRAWTWHDSAEGLLPTTPIEIERFAGPLYLSHGEADTIWSADMLRRLAARLTRHGRRPEVHLLAGQDHAPRGDDENAHHARLIDFFRRALCADAAGAAPHRARRCRRTSASFGRFEDGYQLLHAWCAMLLRGKRARATTHG